MNDMTLREEFLSYLSSKGIQLSPCAFGDEKNVPPREKWDEIVAAINNFGNEVFEEDTKND